MAQHDYVIANGTGAAVRSDINGALAAIVSNNSGATAPSTTYAYMPWADTTTGLYKIRNAANNGWITLYQLDGEWSTIALENGSAAAPSIYFKDSGTDTGIYSPGTDQVAISTGGTVRLSLSTSAISSALAIDHPLGAVGTPSITFTGDLNTGLWSPAADTIAASTGGTERLRIDSSGRVGIGNTAPSDMLHVGTTSAGGNIRLTSSSYGNNGLLWFFGTDGNQKLQLSTGADKGTIYTPANINLAFEIGNAERARIDSSGRLGIGNSAPLSLLHIGVSTSDIAVPSGNFATIRAGSYASASTSGIQLSGGYGDAGTTGAFNIKAIGGGSGGFLATTTLAITTITAFAGVEIERMRIGNNGNVAIGTTDTTGRLAIQVATNGDPGIYFRNQSGTNVGQVQVSSGSVSYVTTSDYRLKENVVPLTGAIDRLQQIPVHRFNFITDTDTTVDGFLAHEAQAVVPECVTGEKDAVDDEGNPVYQGIDQSKLVPLLTAALQEALQKIEDLEGRLTAAGI